MVLAVDEPRGALDVATSWVGMKGSPKVWLGVCRMPRPRGQEGSTQRSKTRMNAEFLGLDEELLRAWVSVCPTEESPGPRRALRRGF
jgi:hypothetical protein